MPRDARVAIELLQLPTVKAMRRSLGADGALAAVGLLIWACGRQGDLGQLTPHKLAKLSDYPGDADILFNEAIDTGLIRRFKDGRVVLPGWQVYFPHEAHAEARRIAGRANVAKRRDRNRTKPEPVPEPEPAPEPEQPAFELLPPEPVEKPAKSDPVPYQRIVDAYHEHFKSGSKVRVISGQTKAFIKARWAEDPQRQEIGWWSDYFAYCEKSDFLAGRADAAPGRKPFLADLQWLVRPTNMEKVINGRFE